MAGLHTAAPSSRRPTRWGRLAYWTGQIRQAMAQGQFVGAVLLSIIGGAQNTSGGQDITTLMNKVAVGLEYVHPAGAARHRLVVCGRWCECYGAAARPSLLIPPPPSLASSRPICSSTRTCTYEPAQRLLLMTTW